MLTYRFATLADTPLLASWNVELIRDEGSANPMNPGQVEDRISRFLGGDYEAAIFSTEGMDVGYALWRPAEHGIYIRQLFVVASKRRQGIGRATVELLLSKILPPDGPASVEVLVGNTPGLAFWHAMGFEDHAIEMSRDRRVESGDERGRGEE